MVSAAQRTTTRTEVIVAVSGDAEVEARDPEEEGRLVRPQETGREVDRVLDLRVRRVAEVVGRGVRACGRRVAREGLGRDRVRGRVLRSLLRGRVALDEGLRDSLDGDEVQESTLTISDDAVLGDAPELGLRLPVREELGAAEDHPVQSLLLILQGDRPVPVEDGDGGVRVQLQEAYLLGRGAVPGCEAGRRPSRPP